MMLSLIASSFQSTPSTRRETIILHSIPVVAVISIHSLHTEGDSLLVRSVPPNVHFNPLPPHGGRQVSMIYPHLAIQISIHSLHTEGDVKSDLSDSEREISIHSLHTEGDRKRRWRELPIATFQSTPSTRRETSQLKLLGWEISNFNPLPPHGGRHFKCLIGTEENHFNPLPPHGGRRFHHPTPRTYFHFNPLPPHGGRHIVLYIQLLPEIISIHSLHTEGDIFQQRPMCAAPGISIHSLHTEGDGK